MLIVPSSSRLILLAIGLSCWSSSSLAQSAPAAKDAPATKDAPAAKDKSDADKSAPSNTAPASTTVPEKGHGSADAPKHTSSEDNPFPEDVSRSAAKAADESNSTATPADVGKNGTSAADRDSGASSSRSHLEGVDDLDSADVPSIPQQTEPIHDSKRSAKDREVGRYYLESGDYVGAYKRLKEALSENPQDPEAAFYLGEAARKVNLSAEARQNYKLALDLDPDGPKAKAARKALASMDRNP